MSHDQMSCRGNARFKTSMVDDTSAPATPPPPAEEAIALLAAPELPPPPSALRGACIRYSKSNKSLFKSLTLEATVLAAPPSPLVRTMFGLEKEALTPSFFSYKSISEVIKGLWDF